MTQLWTTGPAHTFVGQVVINAVGNVTGFGTIAYLGTCEESPDIQLVPKWKDVYNDLGGDVPFDESYQGEVGVINLDLNRFDEKVYERLATRPYPVAPIPAPAPGVFGPGAIGALALTEGLYTTVWVQFPYASKAAMAGMPPGYRFFACYMAGPDHLKPIGTRPRKVNITLVALRYWIPSTGQFVLYDFNMVGLPPVT